MGLCLSSLLGEAVCADVCDDVRSRPLSLGDRAVVWLCEVCISAAR